MAADKGTMKNCFWLERTLLICLLYCAVDGDKQHFLSMLVGLLIHDFIIFVVKEGYSLLKTQFSQFKSRSNFNQIGDNLINDDKGTRKKTQKHEEEGKMCHVSSDNLERLIEQEVMKVKEKYEEMYQQKLLEKEVKFQKDKTLLKDKYNEDREKWEEEKILLKKKCEELRWI